jgi:hypothetical protein
LSAPKPLDVFSNWVYSGSLDKFNRFKFGFLLLCKLHVLIDSCIVPLLRNKIIVVFFNKLSRDAFSLPYVITKYIEENLRNSALKTTMQDVILNSCEEGND